MRSSSLFAGNHDMKVEQYGEYSKRYRRQAEGRDYGMFKNRNTVIALNV